ncbi:MAG: FAD-binding monooxygenase [Pseudonocardia sp. SCN 72-86]|nr:MAG: FAD-binding monooxygenase [Pseudonocardia sp. SCN 72-86]
MTDAPYDAIVVGARCAGSPLAMLLARHGHRVLVLDRAPLPTDTVSTHYLQQYGLSRLRRWGLLDEVVAGGATPITRMTISFADSVIDGFADPIDDIDFTLAPRRTALDPVLLRAAEAAGAEVRLGVTVHDVVVENGVVVGVRVENADGTSSVERARVVVGADGSGSRIASAVGAESYDVVEPSCFIYYTYFTGLDVQFHSRIGLGRQQVGAWPTNDGATLVAVMRTRDRYPDFRRDVEGSFHEVIRQVVPELADHVSGGEQVERFTGIRYPDNFYRTAAGPGWALVGDAGYHKDPFTGKGIADAFVHAELLAARLDEGFTGARPMSDALSDYHRVRDSETRGAYQFTTMISDLDLSPELAGLFRAVSGNPVATRQFLTMVGGGITGEDFFAPANVGAIMAAAA